MKTTKEYVKQGLIELWEQEDGIGVVEIILILVVLIALVIIFKDQLTSIVESIFSGIHSGVDTIVP